MAHPEIDTGFAKLLGMEYVEASAERVVIKMDVRPDLLQPWGILHGGVHCAIVETAASIAAALWLGEAGHVVGVGNHTSFLRAVREGTLTGVATPIHRGRTQQLWLVEVFDGGERAVARGEVRLANIADTDVIGRSGQPREPS